MVSEVWSWFQGSSNSNNNEGYTRLVLVFLVTLITISWCNLLIKQFRKKGRLPPGPRGLLLLGNLPFLKPDLHRHFAQLASVYGPIMKIQLGSKICIVITSQTLAKEVLKDHDTNFADRDPSAVMSVITYNGMGMIWSPYGEHWRMLRKVSVREILNHAKLEGFYSLRRREVRRMVHQIWSKGERPTNIGEQIIVTMWSIMTSTMWGSTADKEERSLLSIEYIRVKQKITKLANELNLSDVFSVLAQVDVQGKKRRMKKHMLWFDQMFDVIINRRRDMVSKGEYTSNEGIDFLQVLLQLIDRGDEKTPFTVTHLKALFLDLIFAGTTTTSNVVEWAMAELIKQPEIMKKIQQELEEVVGINKIVEESHLSKLHYLDAVMKEVLRLHPPVPLLLPRRARQSSVIGGYDIPKGAQVLVNAWAMQRDPQYWSDPLEFRPDRFLNSSDDECDYNGNHFRYIPFGSGRRICPGIPMVERLVPYLLASLFHSFNWELPQGTELDFSETFRTELRKKTPTTVSTSITLSSIVLLLYETRYCKHIM